MTGGRADPHGARFARAIRLSGKGRGAPRDLGQCPYRLHEAVFDGDAVAARYDTRLVVGIDAGMDEQRAFTGMQEVAQFVGARQTCHLQVD